MISIREILTQTEYNILEELLTKVATKNVDYTKITYNLGVGEITINKVEGKESDSYIKGYYDALKKAEEMTDSVIFGMLKDDSIKALFRKEFNKRMAI